MVVQEVRRVEGLRGFWRGLVPSLLKNVPGIGIYFTSVNWMNKTFCTGSKPRPSESLMCGMASRVIAGFLTMPFTVLKTRYESGLFKYGKVSKALLLMTKQEGFRSNFQGMAATVTRDVPYSGIYFMFYNQIKHFLVQDLNLDATNTSTTVICSFSSGILASIITHPPDLIKTHVQMRSTPISYSTSIKNVYLQDGLGGFFKGLSPRLLRRTFMSIIAWTSYEKMLILYRDID